MNVNRETVDLSDVSAIPREAELVILQTAVTHAQAAFAHFEQRITWFVSVYMCFYLCLRPHTS